jgi:hypothetical protein
LGRTNPTYRDTIRALEDNWGEYRRALRRVDKPHFDRLFEHGRTHADAAGYLNHQEPETAFLLSVILEQEKQLQLLEKRVEALETILDSEHTAESVPTSTGRG